MRESDFPSPRHAAHELSKAAGFALGPLAVDPPSRRVSAVGRSEMLEPRVMRVLVAFDSAGGKVLSRDDLIEQCWDGLIVGDNAINQVISRLRRVFDDLAGGAVRLETITKVGFRLLVDGQQPGGIASGEPQPEVAAHTASAIEEPPPLVLHSRKAVAAFVVAGLLVAGGVIALFSPGQGTGKSLSERVAFFGMSSPRQQPDPLAGARYTRLTDFPGFENDAAISRDGRFVAFRSDRDGTADTWVSRIGSGRFLNLTEGARSTVQVRNMGFTPDGSEVWLSSFIGGDRMRTIPLLGGAPRPFLSEHAIEVAWSTDGKRLVYHTYDGGDPMFVADGTGEKPRQIFKGGPDVHNHFPVWSRDGQWIYFVSGIWNALEMDIWRVRPDGADPERLTHLSTDITYLSVLDDRTVLYTALDENGAGPWLWSLDTQRRTSRRRSSGLEVYTSVDASADGRKLVASVANPTATLWSVPILDRPATEADVTPVKVSSVRAYAPRFGASGLFYLSSRGGGDGLWRDDNGQATEIWRGSEGALREPTAVSPDGRRLAVVLRKQGKRTLHLLASDGADLQPLAPALDVTSSVGWSPDGAWIVAGGVDAKGPGLFKIPVGGGAPVRLTRGPAATPVWSPDGSVIVYTGAVAGVNGPLLAVRPDGASVEAPPISVRVNTEHYRFIPGTQELVYLPTPSQVEPENFWAMDLKSKKTRRLATFDSRSNRSFDITPDGKRIIFDRMEEHSNLVLIELAAAQ